MVNDHPNQKILLSCLHINSIIVKFQEAVIVD